MNTPFFHLLKGGCVDEVACLLGHGRMNGNVVSPSVEFIDANRFDPHLFNGLLTDVGVIGDHIHLEPLGTVHHHPADATHSDDAEGLVEDLLAAKTLFLPLAFTDGCGCLGDVAAQRQQHGNGVFRGGDDVTFRGVHDHDTALAGSGDVNVVETNARPGHDLKAIGRFDNVFCHLGGAADHQGIVFLDDLSEFLGGQAGVDLHLKVGYRHELLNSRFCQLITHQNLHSALLNRSIATPGRTRLGFESF